VMPSRIATLWVLLPLLMGAAPAAAQNDMYAVSHPFALPTATTTRLFGMGGFASCIPDVGFANPAFAGALTRDSVVVRNAVTSFEGDLSLSSQQGSFAMPLQDNRQGLQVSVFRLESNNALYGGFGAPALLSLAEYDVSVHYGRRLTDNWLAGIAVSPVFHNSVNVVPVGAPGSLMRLTAGADWGFRLGTVYELGDRGWIGAIYDRYDESVNGSGLPFGAVPMAATFHSEEIVAGIAYRLTDRLLAGVEWQQLSHRSGAFENAEAGLRFGFEGLLDEGLAIRMGSNQGAFSVGLGWANDDWSLNYAFIRDWNGNVFGDVYGGSKTHGFELTHSW
jgi:hypothetical protein